MLFRKKPVVIEATLFDGKNQNEVMAWAAKVAKTHETPFIPLEDTMLITTLEGEMQVSAGDWIIQGVKGEFYPCKPDIFTATYEAVE
jgi:hypothetical protein